MPDRPSNIEVELDSAELQLLEEEDVAEDPTGSGPAAPSASVERTPEQKKVIAAWRTELGLVLREVEAIKAREPAKAAMLLGAVAAVYLSNLGDAAKADELSLQAQALLSTDASWLLALRRRIAMCRGDHALALTLLRAELKTQGEPKERAALLLALGTCEEIVQHDAGQAKQLLKEANELAPADIAVAWSLVELHAASNEPLELIGALRRLIDASVDPGMRSMLHHYIGTVEEVARKDLAAAATAYQHALHEDPHNLVALANYGSLCLQKRQWRELAALLVKEAALVDDPRAVSRLSERAGDLFWELSDDGEAASAAYRKAASAAPSELPPLRKLAQVLESLGRYNDLIVVYRDQLKLEQLPTERAELFHRIGEVFEYYLQSIDEAEAAYQAALAEEPNHSSSLVALETLYRRNDRYTELVRLGLTEAEKIPQTLRRADRYFDVARMVAERLNNNADALKLFQHCADLVPGHRAAFEYRERIYIDERRYHELATLYETQLPFIKDPVMQRFYQHELGRLLKERIENGKRASKHFEMALAIGAADLNPLFQLIRIHEAAADWASLAAVLERLLLALTDPIEIITVLHRLGRLHEFELHDDEKALAAHHRVLVIDKKNAHSLRAIAALHYRNRRWAELIETYRAQLPLADNKEERATTQYRIARIEERRLVKRQDAIVSYEAALAEFPFQPALRALDRVLRQEKQWPRLVEVLQREVARAMTPLDRGHILSAIGQLFELHVDDLAGAEKAYKEALVQHPALDGTDLALMQVHEKKGQLKELRARYENLLENTDKPRTKVAILCRLGTLCEHALGDPAQAAANYRTCFDLSRLGESMLLAFVRASQRQFGTAGVVAAYRVAAARTKDKRFALDLLLLGGLREELQDQSTTLFAETHRLGGKQPALLDGLIRTFVRDGHLRVGEMPEAQLGQVLVERAAMRDDFDGGLLWLEAACLFDRLAAVPKSASAYEAASRQLPGFLPVLRGIRRIAAGKSQWPQVVTLLQREAEIAEAVENKTAAMSQAAEVLTMHLSDYKQALRLYRDVLDLDPTNDRAFQRARGICENLEDFDSLASIYTTLAEATTEPLAKAAHLRAQALLYRDRLSSPNKAIQSLRAATKADPTVVGTHLMLAELEVKAGFWQDAANSYRTLGALSSGNEMGRTARFSEAKILDEKLGDRDAAAKILEELVVDPADREAALYMAGLAERMGNWARATELYRQLLEGATERDHVAYLLALGFLLRDRLDNAAGAKEALREAFAAALGNPELVLLIEAHMKTPADWLQFAELGEESLSSARVVAAPQSAMRLALANAYRDKLKRPDLAERHLKASISIAPDDPAPYLQLGQQELDAGKNELAQAHFRKVLEIAPLSTKAFAGLGTASQKQGAADIGRILQATATYLEGGKTNKPLGAFIPAQPPGLAAIRAVMPQNHTAGALAIAEIFRQLEPVAAEIVTELSPTPTRGELLLDADPIAQLTGQLAALFSLAPLRVFVDPTFRGETQLVSDGGIALSVGSDLISPFAQGRLVFSLISKLHAIAEQATLSAFFQPTEITQLLQLVLNDNAPESQKEMRRRFMKQLPRRNRKEIERVLQNDIKSLPADVVAFYKEQQRVCDRLGLLISRDPGAAFEMIVGTDRAQVGANARAVELLRFVAGDNLARAYHRLSTPT